jgi:hypothetical protein
MAKGYIIFTEHITDHDAIDAYSQAAISNVAIFEGFRAPGSDQ